LTDEEDADNEDEADNEDGDTGTKKMQDTQHDSMARVLAKIHRDVLRKFYN